MRNLFQCSRYGFGVVLVVMVAFIWVFSSQLIQVIFNGSSQDQKYDKPFLLTYSNTTMFSLWLTGFLCIPSWQHRAWKDQRVNIDSSDSLEAGEALNAYGSTDAPTASEVVALKVPAEAPSCEVTPMTIREVLGHSILFAPVWCAANWTFNMSLGRTTVGSNTVLSSTSGLFTFLVGWIALGEPFNAWKLVGVVVSGCGATLVALYDVDSSHGTNTLAGDILALLSAFLYACYVCLLKYQIPEDRGIPMPMFFGFIGLTNFLMLWPILLFLNAMQWESLELPTLRVGLLMLLNSLIGTNLSDVLWAQAVLYTSPLVATLGITLTIPLAMISDFLLHGYTFAWQYCCGAVLVFVAFVLVNVAPMLPHGRPSHRLPLTSQ